MSEKIQKLEKFLEEKNKKPRVLITYIESGMGHIMSANAIANKLKEKYGNELEIIEEHIMKCDNNKKQIKFEKFMSGQVKITNKVKGYGAFMFWLLEKLGQQRSLELIHKTIFKKATDGTIEAMRKRNPDVVISTHHFITLCAIELKKRYMPNLTIITYDPDNNVHCWWDNRSEIFITNNEIAVKEAIEKRKFKPEALKKVFFTARDSVVNAEGTKEDFRRKYGIPLDKFAVIVADGAYASANAKKYTLELMKTDLPLTIVMLAGKNEKVLNYFKKKAKKTKSNITLMPMGFTDKAHELYGACDVFITKGGPNAILDSLYMGTPVLANFYAQNMEKATINLFVNIMGCGVAIYNKKKARKQVEEWIKNPQLLDVYKDNIKKQLDKNQNGSSQIADIIMEEIEKKEKAV